MGKEFGFTSLVSQCCSGDYEEVVDRFCSVCVVFVMPGCHGVVLVGRCVFLTGIVVCKLIHILLGAGTGASTGVGTG